MVNNLWLTKKKFRMHIKHNANVHSDGVILNMLNQRENSLYQAKYEVFRQ